MLAAVRYFACYGLAYNVGLAALSTAAVLPVSLVLMALLPRPRSAAHDPVVLAVLSVILAIGVALPLLLWRRHRKKLRAMPAMWQVVGVVACCTAAALSLTIALMVLLL